MLGACRDEKKYVHRIDTKDAVVHVAAVGANVVTEVLGVNASQLVWIQDGEIVQAPKQAGAKSDIATNAPISSIVFAWQSLQQRPFHAQEVD